MNKPVKKLSVLTSLRFFAAFLIVVAHMGTYPSEWSWLAHFNPDQAVSFFFILSGFILSYVYQNFSRSDIPKFIIARFARLWPCHIFTMILLVCVSPPRLTQAVHSAPLLLIPVLHILMLQSWVPVQKMYASLNSPSWSISTEFFFYLLFPFLSSLQNKKLLSVIALIMTAMFLLVMLGQWLHISPDNHAYLNLVGLFYIWPICRLLEFIAGIVTFRFFNSIRVESATSFKRSSLLEIAALILLLAVMWVSNESPVMNWLSQNNPPFYIIFHMYGLTMPFFCFFIGVVARGKGVFSKLLQWAPLVFLGEISYALYLVHFSILRIAYIHSQPFIVILLILLVASTFIYFFVETPLRRLLTKVGVALLDNTEKAPYTSSSLLNQS